MAFSEIVAECEVISFDWGVKTGKIEGLEERIIAVLCVGQEEEGKER